MKMRFAGEYTNGRTSLVAFGVTFEGYEPSEVPPNVAGKFAGHPEFIPADPLDHDGDGEKGGSLPDAPDDELEALRLRYEELAGKKPHHMMKAPRLIEEILKMEGE